MKVRILILIFLSLTMLGCDSNADAHNAAGEIDNTELTGVDSLRISLPADVIITQGAPALVIRTNDEQSEHIKWSVEGTDLNIGSFDDDDDDYNFRSPIRIELTLPTLKSVAAAGSGNIDINGVDSESFSIKIAGSGSVKAVGTTATLAMKIAGSGNIDAGKLEAKSANVVIAGSGNIETHATDQLAVKIAGSGDVTYHGKPSLAQTVIGSGKVRAAR